MASDTSFVIVAAGRGERFGHHAKVLVPVAGKPMLAWSIEAALRAPCVKDVVVVAGEHTVDEIRAVCRDYQVAIPISIVHGGPTRQASVAAGVAAIGEDASLVLVHDAARPLVMPELIERCATAAREHGAAIAAMPVTDTLKHVTDQRIDRTVPREHLCAAQTPQAFRRELLTSAMTWIRDNPAWHTDEASIMEAMGITVHIVEGAVTNLKVTHPEDIALAEALLLARTAESPR